MTHDTMAGTAESTSPPEEKLLLTAEDLTRAALVTPAAER